MSSNDFYMYINVMSGWDGGASY